MVNELLEYLYTEQGGAVVPEAMRTDTDQMQTAFAKVCSLVADVSPALVLDCKNMVEYWGTEIWCHAAAPPSAVPSTRAVAMPRAHALPRAQPSPCCPHAAGRRSTG